ncbi:MAG TPA: hypothetical protein VHM19_02340 [Polyangiales bacterium]|nr:hypothetical protein [Polyangiales bacterium]
MFSLRERLSRIVCALLACCTLGGCAMQAMGGAQTLHHTAGMADIGGRWVGTRKSGAYGGGDVVMAQPAGGTFGVRQVIATGGYRALLSPFSLELGADLGAGEPAAARWGGTSAYLGASTGVLFRILGHQDSEVGYLPAGYLLDAVLTVRGGVWGRPGGDPRAERGELSALLGLRITGISDLVVSDNDNWKP